MRLRMVLVSVVVASLLLLAAGCQQTKVSFPLNEGWTKASKSEIKHAALDMYVLEYAKHFNGSQLAVLYKGILEKHFENDFANKLGTLGMSFGARVNTVSEPIWINVGNKRVMFATAERPKKYYFYAFFAHDKMYVLVGITEPHNALWLKREMESMLERFNP